MLCCPCSLYIKNPTNNKTENWVWFIFVNVVSLPVVGVSCKQKKEIYSLRMVMIYHRSELSVKSPVPSYRTGFLQLGSSTPRAFPVSSTTSSLEMGKKNAEEFRSHLENPFSK